MGSGCMVDSGLWEACHESRAMMKRTYPTPQWYNGETATGLATDQRGVTRRYTFVPSRDVLVISLLNFLHAFIDPDREIDCVYDVPPARNNSAGSPFSVQSPPIFGARGKYPRRLKLSDMRLIAVSLDVDWELDDVDWQPEDVEIRKVATLDLFAQMTALLNPYTIVYLYWSNIGHAGIAGAIGDTGARFHTENGYFGPFQRL